MAKKPGESPFQALEQAAYLAYREWPIWLVLRQRELEAHLERARAAAQTKTPRRNKQEEDQP